MLAGLFVWLIMESLWVFWAVLFFLLLVASEVGFRVGRWQASRRGAGEKEISSVGAISAGMIGLLAFTLGLTISIAQDRFEVRRNAVVQEANTIGTAWLRAGLIGGEDGKTAAALIEDYAKVRLAYTQAATAAEEPPVLAATNALQSRIWQLAKEVAQRAPTPITATLINSLNDMFDASLVQRFAFESRVPISLSWVLLDGALLTIGAVGYHLGISGVRQIVLTSLLLAMWSGGLVLIVDLNRPRIGSIRVDPAPLIWTIQGFQSPPTQR